MTNKISLCKAKWKRPISFASTITTASGIVNSNMPWPPSFFRVLSTNNTTPKIYWTDAARGVAWKSNEYKKDKNLANSSKQRNMQMINKS